MTSIIDWLQAQDYVGTSIASRLELTSDKAAVVYVTDSKLEAAEAVTKYAAAGLVPVLVPFTRRKWGYPNNGHDERFYLVAGLAPEQRAEGVKETLVMLIEARAEDEDYE